MTAFLQVLVTGLSIGCVYALVALGFVLVYKATEVVNFAQGEVMMVGAFFAYSFVDLGGLPFGVGLALAMIAAAAFGALLNLSVLRPLVGRSPFVMVLATVAIASLLRAVASMIPGWGTQTHALSTPYARATWDAGGVIISATHLVVIGSTLALCGLLFLFFRYARIGVALQAVSQNQLAAGYCGIPVKRMHALVWALSAAVSALAGALLAPMTFVHANMGYVGLKAFPAAVIGGFGSIPGAILGGLFIGVIEEVAGLYAPEGVKNVAAYIALLVLLVVRPQGFLGLSLRERA
jgi:branched-chain amino acid transport system permease protein